MSNCFASTRIAFYCGLALISLAVAARSQPQAQEQRPRIKDFGSSLKRLKWDEKKRAAVETEGKGGRRSKENFDDEEVLRVETSLVVCDVLVLDERGRSVRGLTRDDFLVTEDGQPQPVGTFALGDSKDVPRSIVLILDYSVGQLGFIKESVEAAKTLVDSLGPRDRMAVVTDEVKLLVDFTGDKALLRERLDSLIEKPASREQLFRQARKLDRSAHYSALLAALRELFDAEDTRPIIILQAHGNEASLFREPVGFNTLPPGLSHGERTEAQSYIYKIREFARRRKLQREYGLRDIYAAAERSRATIYSVIPGVRLVGLSPGERVERITDWEEKAYSAWDEAAPGGRAPQQLRRKEHWALVLDAEGSLEQQLAMMELSKLTGGWADFIEEPSQAAQVYARILSDINTRYVVGFYPTNKERDGKRRQVRIEVKGHPEYTVWGRKSYYAPEPEQ